MPIVSITTITGGNLTLPTDAIQTPFTSSHWLVAGVPPTITGRHAVVSCVPLDGVPNNAVAILTDTARANMARIVTEGLGFIVNEFQAGRGGYDVNDPTQATSPAPAATALIDPVYPTSSTYASIDETTYPNNAAVSFLCRLEATEAIHGLGELGLIATVTASPLFPSEVGTKFLFAVAHVPLQGKTLQHTYGWRIIVAP